MKKMRTVLSVDAAGARLCAAICVSFLLIATGAHAQTDSGDATAAKLERLLEKLNRVEAAPPPSTAPTAPAMTPTPTLPEPSPPVAASRPDTPSVVPQPPVQAAPSTATKLERLLDELGRNETAPPEPPASIAPAASATTPPPVAAPEGINPTIQTLGPSPKAATAQPAAHPARGTWKGRMLKGGTTSDQTLQFQIANDGTVSGTFQIQDIGEFSISGSMNGDMASLEFAPTLLTQGKVFEALGLPQDAGLDISKVFKGRLKGRLNGDKITGMVEARVYEPAACLIHMNADHPRHAEFLALARKKLGDKFTGPEVCTLVEDETMAWTAKRTGPGPMAAEPDRLSEKPGRIKTTLSKPQPPVAQQAAPNGDQIKLELAFWESIKDSKDAALFEAYMARFPNGTFVPIARARIAALGKPAGPNKQAQPAPGTQQLTAPPPLNDCDRLAAHPSDPDKVAEGVDWRNINPDSALPACRSAVAAYPGVDRFTFQLGRALQKSKSFADAKKQYQLAAQRGYVMAMSNLGVMYKNGLGVTKDEIEAVRWFRLATDEGNAAAMRNLGVMYKNGWGVTKDETEAVRWFRRASDEGNAAAMTNLGVMFAKGRGVTEDLTEAAKWYRKAVEKGHLSAMYYLGKMYLSGEGVAEDRSKGINLLSTAADKGQSNSMFLLAILFDNENFKLAASYMIRAIKAKNRSAIRFMLNTPKKMDFNALAIDYRKALQRQLAVEGVYSGAINGNFGLATKRAIEALVKKRE